MAYNCKERKDLMTPRPVTDAEKVIALLEEIRNLLKDIFNQRDRANDEV
jgi:hypothetical protein